MEPVISSTMNGLAGNASASAKSHDPSNNLQVAAGAFQDRVHRDLLLNVSVWKLLRGDGHGSQREAKSRAGQTHSCVEHLSQLAEVSRLYEDLDTEAFCLLIQAFLALLQGQADHASVLLADSHELLCEVQELSRRQPQSAAERPLTVFHGVLCTLLQVAQGEVAVNQLRLVAGLFASFVQMRHHSWTHILWFAAFAEFLWEVLVTQHGESDDAAVCEAQQLMHVLTSALKTFVADFPFAEAFLRLWDGWALVCERQVTGAVACWLQGLQSAARLGIGFCSARLHLMLGNCNWH